MKTFLIGRVSVRLYGIYGLVLLLCSSCLNEDKRPSRTIHTAVDSVSLSAVDQPVPAPSYPVISPSIEDDDEEDSPKGIDDGSYTATVDYTNPNTGYSATYTLTVDVSNGQIVQINFPSGGYLDDDHISPADIDEDGNANVEGEDGKTYAVHIDL